MKSITATIRQAIISSPFAGNIKAAYLFGSYATQEQTEASDVDILVELKTPMGYDFFRLQEYLSEFLGKPVDLQTTASVSRYILPYIDRQKQLVYEG